MYRSVFLVLLLVTLSANAATRPNVVVILADDLGWADLACYGSKFHLTPNLDRLASQGLRFTEGYAACPVCSPTRAALLTGKSPARLGLTDWLPGRPDRPDQQLARPPLPQHLPLAEVTLAEAFRKAGYVTGHIGKWHLGGKGFGPLEQGFSSNIAGDQTGTPRSYFAPYSNKQGTIPGLEKAPAGEYLTDRLGLEAERFIERHKDQPFFLYLPHHAVHTPMRAKAELVARYSKKHTPGTQSNAVYAAMLESLDDAVGAVLRKLDALKLAENTLVVFTSDNGGLATLEGMPMAPTTNAPMREGKGYLYEGGIRVPWIVRWPGVVKPNTRSDVPIITQDLFPTLLEACGIEGYPAHDGVSLVPLWKGGPAPIRDALYWHYPHYPNQGGKPGGAIRMGSLKLIEFYEDSRRELFDLKSDPREGRNLAGARPADVKRLADQLDRWRKGVGARMPTPNPGYVPNPQRKDGSILLHARSAHVHGTQLRFEPLPHKNTLGYWTEVADLATWELTVDRPGRFSIEVVQGCGKGQGGSEVEVEVGGHKVKFLVEDTGGFQSFKARQVGSVDLEKPGRLTLTLRALRKAKGAIGDFQQITLRPMPH